MNNEETIKRIIEITADIKGVSKETLCKKRMYVQEKRAGIHAAIQMTDPTCINKYKQISDNFGYQSDAGKSDAGKSDAGKSYAGFGNALCNDDVPASLVARIVAEFKRDESNETENTVITQPEYAEPQFEYEKLLKQPDSYMPIARLHLPKETEEVLTAKGITTIKELILLENTPCYLVENTSIITERLSRYAESVTDGKVRWDKFDALISGC